MNVAMKFLVFTSTLAIVCSAYDMYGYGSQILNDDENENLNGNVNKNVNGPIGNSPQILDIAGRWNTPGHSRNCANNQPSDVNQPGLEQPGTLTSRVYPDVPANGFLIQAREYQSMKIDSTIWKFKKGEWCFRPNFKHGGADVVQARRMTIPSIPS